MTEPAAGELVFVAVCPRCGQPLDVVPVELGGWHAAELWCYLAARAHTVECGCAPASGLASATERRRGPTQPHEQAAT